MSDSNVDDFIPGFAIPCHHNGHLQHTRHPQARMCLSTRLTASIARPRVIASGNSLTTVSLGLSLPAWGILPRNGLILCEVYRYSSTLRPHNTHSLHTKYTCIHLLHHHTATRAIVPGTSLTTVSVALSLLAWGVTPTDICKCDCRIGQTSSALGAGLAMRCRSRCNNLLHHCQDAQ